MGLLHDTKNDQVDRSYMSPGPKETCLISFRLVALFGFRFRNVTILYENQTQSKNLVEISTLPPQVQFCPNASHGC
ncbi:hypothetical protein MANES_14G127621v8 [Manihot esculenta]|uniref:Uncharacterized protein n=1 Tax=Manihot esculenta TaxID=3983 RepID=A0ACB7GID3_MANES|nr:hypothetical protein MANES_14G127621v8 [Manihot esculenta]